MRLIEKVSLLELSSTAFDEGPVHASPFFEKKHKVTADFSRNVAYQGSKVKLRAGTVCHATATTMAAQ